MNGAIDLDTDTIKVALVTSSYTPNADTHEDMADITNEVTGTGYNCWRSNIGNKTVTADTTDDEGVFELTMLLGLIQLSPLVCCCL
jgi:hypothetical protein